MTLEQTRQLGIEFERRIQTMIPETEYVSKLDTETIYSYLNQYQDKFIHDIYKSLDTIPAQSTPSAYIETILQGMLSIYSDSITIINDIWYEIPLPESFGLYLSSATDVKNTYNYKNDTSIPGVVQNILIPATKVDEFLQRPQDSMRIMRNPIAYFGDSGSAKKLYVLYDKYTKPDRFILRYYRIPNYMNLMTSSACELPMEAFDDLVTGAVDLYVQYVAGAEARKRQLREQSNKRAREDERDARNNESNRE